MSSNKWHALLVGVVMGALAGTGAGLALAAKQDDMVIEQQRMADFKKGVVFGCNGGGWAKTEREAECQKLAELAVNYAGVRP